MIAPSEKHLEDWIVKTSDIGVGFEVLVIGRQVNLPSGRADLITSDDLHHLTVVELKKDRIQARDVIQILRYTRDVRRIFTQSTLELPQPDYSGDWLLQFNCQGRVNGVLIGHAFDEDVLSACEAANIYTIAYQYHKDETYSFDWRFASLDVGLYETYGEYAVGVLGEVSREIWKKKLTEYYTPEKIRKMFQGQNHG